MRMLKNIFKSKKGLLTKISMPLLLAFVFVSCSGVDHSTLARCLRDSGTVFYGASWCPHCEGQRDSFGAGQSELPYVECSVGPTAASGQTQICIQNSIRTYPTWDFPNAGRVEGVLTLETIAQAAGCPFVADSNSN